MSERKERQRNLQSIIAMRKFETWWKAKNFNGPTFCDVYVQGFLDGYFEGRKLRGRK